MEEGSQDAQTEGPKKSQKTLVMVAGVVVIALVVGGGVFLSGNRNQPSTSQQSNDETQSTTTVPVVSTSTPLPSQTQSGGAVSSETTEKVREVAVEGKEFSFSPSSLSLKKGEKVKVVFKNTGKMTHDFVVEELNVKTKIISGGQTDSVEFTVPTDAKELTYYCGVGNHRKQGMEGKISIQ